MVEMWKYGQPSDKEALEIILRYLQISDPEKRKELMALAEKYARESTPSIIQDNQD